MLVRKKRFNFIYRIVSLITLSLGLLLFPVVSRAQDVPCDGSDPTGTATNCPLDTWVWVLVIAALVFGAMQLHHRQKLQKQA